MEDLTNFGSDSASSLQSLQDRYILTQTGLQQLIFPSKWVTEVILVERDRVLNLPFYHPMVLGVVHRQGVIVPLISAHLLLSEKLGQTFRLPAVKEALTVVWLGQAAQSLAGIGVVVEQILGGVPHEQVTEQHLFQLSDVPEQIWQPC